MNNADPAKPARPLAHLWPALALSCAAHGAALGLAPWALPGGAPPAAGRLEARLVAPATTPHAPPLVGAAAPAPPARPGATAEYPAVGPTSATATPATPPAAGELDALPYPLEPVTPTYPPHLGSTGARGEVVLALAIAETGAVAAVEVLSAEPPGLFDAAAVAAFRDARFAPGRASGRAVAARVTASVVFEPHGPAP